MNKEEIPMIEEYRHESAMVHETKKSKYAAIVAIVALVMVVKDFTTKYNARTNKWLDTIMTLVNRTTVTEVTDEYSEILQQLPPP